MELCTIRIGDLNYEYYYRNTPPCGGGGSAIVTPLTVTANGTYTAPQGEGYSPVSVSVASKLPQMVDGSLATVTAEDLAGITKIKHYAFYDCTSLISVNIPNGVTSIAYCAFSDCSSLALVTLSTGITSIERQAFSYCSSLASINIPSGVTSIGQYAFQYCSSLASINIPSGVTSIEQYTFCMCSSLASINIPSGVTSIGNKAFYYCSSLSSIDIPSGITSIGNYAFYSCNRLMTIICRRTTPPTISNANAFTSVPSNCSIYVPDSSVDSYKAANIWKTRASYIFPLSQYNPNAKGGKPVVPEYFKEDLEAMEKEKEPEEICEYCGQVIPKDETMNK